MPSALSQSDMGYAFDRAQEEPCYIQPLLLDAQEPTDGEIVKMSGRQGTDG